MRHAAIALTTAIAMGVTVMSASTHAQQQTAPGHGAFYAPDKLQWKDGPASLPPGAKFVVLEGNPSAKGYFALRLSLPDGYIIPPHWHPVQERVTVISGTFEVGMGSTVEPDSMETNPAGSYVTLPPKAPHFARASGPTVLQLTSIGPWELHYVNPKDDPRKRK